MILAIEDFETDFESRIRISSSRPDSFDFPSEPFGRPSCFPLARATANPSRVRSEIRSRSISAKSPNMVTMTLVCMSCFPSSRMFSFMETRRTRFLTSLSTS